MTKISGLDDLAGARGTLVATLALGTMLATLEDRPTFGFGCKCL